MKKMNTSPISGMLELLPERQAVFNDLKRKIEEVYHRHGFLLIETPTIERTEVLFAKAGGETEKQIYRVVKTEETSDSADQALRFDHTVPLARYVAEHESELAFPFRVTQIARNFRGERSQKGRFREFYQCDVDIIGRGELPIEYDVEIISALAEAYSALGLEGRVIRISNRKILTGILEELNLQEVAGEIFRIIDRAEKVSPEKTQAALEALGIGEEKIARVLAFIEIFGTREEVVARLSEFKFENPTFKEGVEELGRVLELLEAQEVDGVIGDMKIVRGLDYYTGTVFETFLTEHREIGSIGGGGRYENLTGLYNEQVMPGVGGSIGLTRLFYIMNELKMLPEGGLELNDFAIIPISKNENKFALKVARKLRESGKRVDVVLTEKKLGDKLKHATRIAKAGVVIGEEEVKTGKFCAKDFKSGETRELA